MILNFAKTLHMNTILEKTLATIVTENHQAASVFEKYNLDFCCKGKRSLHEACTEKNVSAEDITKEIEAIISAPNNKHLPFTEMTEEQLVTYILIHHHFYVKQSMPTIISHLEKVAYKHGERYNYMITVFQLFQEIQQEMIMHMHKEEMILFPRIKEISSAKMNGQPLPNADFITGPIQVMEMEHDHAGEIMQQIKQLTTNYTPPEGACTTFKVVLNELQAFEEDLHQHVHLENNILFPKAMSTF